MRIWIWDLVVVVLLLLCVLLAYRRGFLRTLVQLFGTVLAFAGAWMASAPVAERGYDLLLKKGISEAVQEGVVQYGLESFSTLFDRLDEILLALPQVVANAIRSELDADSLAIWYEKVLRANSGDIAAGLTEGVVAPIVTAMLQMLAFCLLFLTASILLRLLARLLGGVRHLPLVGGVDGLLGALLGAVQGAVYVFVLAAVLWLLLRLSGDSLGFVTEEEIGKTLLFSRFFQAVASFGLAL